MCEQGVPVRVNGHLTGSDVLINLLLPLLPTPTPEPLLVGGHGQRRAKLDDAILTFCDLDLCARFVETHTSPQLGREREKTAPLEAHVRMKAHVVTLSKRS